MLSELEQARRDLSRISRELTDRRKVGKRTCSNCKGLFGPDGFYRSKSGTRYWCKQCENRSRREWRANNREKESEYYRAAWLRRKQRRLNGGKDV